MNSVGRSAEDPWAVDWMPADSPPPTEAEVLVVVRDSDGELLLRIGSHYQATQGQGEDDHAAFWSFEYERWPLESIVKWRPLPPI